jgi:hypothetical protein
MVFDNAGPACEREDLVVRNREPISVGRRYRHVLYALFLASAVNKFEFLAAERLLQDRLKTRFQRWFENIIFVRVNRSLDDVFTETVGGIDQHHVAKTGFSVDGKHDSGSAKIRPDHLLHGDRERDLVMIEPFVDSIGNGAVGEQRRETAPARIEQRRVSFDI